MYPIKSIKRIKKISNYMISTIDYLKLFEFRSRYYLPIKVPSAVLRIVLKMECFPETSD